MSLLYHTFENSTVDKSSRIECRIYMNWNKLFVNQLYLPKTVWVGIISFNILFQNITNHVCNLNIIEKHEWIYKTGSIQ